MQASDMATFRLLRSQFHHLNFPNYSIFRNRHHQNPKSSRHFSPPLNPQFIHSINLKQFPESPLLVVNSQAKQTTSNSPHQEPISDKNPNVWSVFSSTGTNPRISKSVEESVEDRGDTVLRSSLGRVNSQAKQTPSNSPPQEPISDKNPNISSAFSSTGTNPRISKSVEESVEDRGNTVLRSSLGRGKKGKVNWVCSDCGHSEGQWWGICKSCKKVGTLEPFSMAENSEKRKLSGVELSENAMRSWLPQQKGGHAGPVRLIDVNRGFNDSDWRIQLSGIFGAEVARVLGGGIVPGSLTLVGGDPGVGKSTLLLQLAALIAESCNGAAPVVYISGEESVEQIGNRADRLNIDTEDLYLYSGTDVEDILEKVQPFCPCALIIDSIQTVYLKGVAGSPGGPVQLKECTAALLRFSKKTNIPVLLIGHVTKCGDIAGPRVLEHIVDSVLYMEGEKHSSHRLLRSVKNRFGSTDELGVFEMLESGLQAVVNPSAMFLSEEHSNSEHLAGLAVAVIIDGSRTFLIEVQALCVADSVGKHYNGVVASRAEMIISVLKKQAGLKMQDYSVFLNVVSGLSLTETSGDLAVAAAICSSFLELPIPNHAAFIGEIGLGGEIRTVPRIDKRVTTLAKLGYKTCIVPKLAEKALVGLRFEGLQVVGCENLKEVIDSLQKMRK